MRDGSKRERKPPMSEQTLLPFFGFIVCRLTRFVVVIAAIFFVVAAFFSSALSSYKLLMRALVSVGALHIFVKAAAC